MDWTGTGRLVRSLWSTDGKTQIVRGITEEIERYMLERGAYGALRVMVNCNQMGEAAARQVAGMLKSAGARPNCCT